MKWSLNKDLKSEQIILSLDLNQKYSSFPTTGRSLETIIVFNNQIKMACIRAFVSQTIATYLLLKRAGKLCTATRKPLTFEKKRLLYRLGNIFIRARRSQQSQTELSTVKKVIQWSGMIIFNSTFRSRSMHTCMVLFSFFLLFSFIILLYILEIPHSDYHCIILSGEFMTELKLSCLCQTTPRLEFRCLLRGKQTGQEVT